MMMKSYVSVKWAALVVVFLGQASVNAVEVGVFSESVVNAAFESGSGLFIVRVISQRQGEAGKFCFYKVRIVDAIVAGDTEGCHRSDLIEIFAGSSYGDRLKADGRYALFIRQEGRCWFSWAHRDDVIEIPEKGYYWPLVAKATEVYNASSIRAFREPRREGSVSMPDLPEEIVRLCKQFRTARKRRAGVAREIYDSDLGSRVDMSKPESSLRIYQEPKIALYRDQIESLLGDRTLKSGWDYHWFCGEDRGSKGADNLVGVLSARFDEGQKCVRLVYELHESQKWERPRPGRSGRQPPPEDVGAVIEAFQEAISNSDWDKAVSLCSEKVSNKAKESDSLEVFFNSVVPIKGLLSETDVRVRGRGSRDNQVTRYSFDVPVRFPEKDDGLDWEWSVVKSGDSWLVDFKPKPLEIQMKHHRMMQERYNRRGDARGHELRIEKMRKGLEIYLVPLAGKFVIGKPMLFRMKLVNVSEETLGFGQTSWMVNDPMIVTGPDGKRVPYMDTSYQTAVWSEFIDPGETMALIESYDVTSQYHITKPGKYSFQFTSFYLKQSNTVEFEVKDGELSPQEIATERLKPIVPKGWDFSRRVTSGKQFGGEDVGRCLGLGMIDRKAGKEWNASIYISVFLDCDKSQIDYRSHLGEFWGDCRWGPVYVRSYNAAMRWPGYKSQLMNALGIK
ncbi:MAG: hypothetical protein ACYS4W_07285 [Planctomycetota bacterium]|jgi:hypothetical protein